MLKHEESQEWMRRALSSLEKARLGQNSERIMIEDLCFDIQQSVEKSLKAVCIYNGIVFKKTHDISYLIDLLEGNGIKIGDDVKSAKYLTQYAIETRYPGLYDPIPDEEFHEALSHAEIVFKWASSVTNFKL